MRITILNGNPTPDSAFDGYVAHLARALADEQHAPEVLRLRELDLRYCTGCFGCWVKTPGQCVVTDDSARVCRAVINADFVLWAAPLVMGFPSALFKQALDKSIPLIHPYFAVVDGEAHHRARYDRYPRFGLLVGREADTDAEDLKIVGKLLSRTALNLKSGLAFTKCTDEPVEAVVRAITAWQPMPAPPRPPAPTTGVRVVAPQRLTVFNGSPRGRKGNTPVLLGQVAAGFEAAGGSHALYHLNRVHQTPEHVAAFAGAEAVLLGFPLYTDAMPALVKSFVEALAPLRLAGANPPLAFLVQSGFPESAHSRYVEQYLRKLAQRLGSPYLGTIVKGGCEGVRLMPERMNRKLFAQLQDLGRTLRMSGELPPDLLRRVASPERYPRYLMPGFRLLVNTPFLRFYWDTQLKKHGAFEQHNAQPYLETDAASAEDLAVVSDR
jgi:multimeric flavodoxin WrbA